MKRILNKFDRAGFAILLTLIGFANLPTLARSESIRTEQSTSSDICAPDPSGELYLTDLQLAHFRKLSASSASSASFYDLSVDDRKTVSEILRVGHGAGLFAARLLRDLLIIEAVAQQAQCKPDEACVESTVIKDFKIGKMKDQSWEQLAGFWRRMRDEDAKAARACLKLAASLPTRTLPPVAEQQPLQAAQVAAAEQPSKLPIESSQDPSTKKEDPKGRPIVPRPFSLRTAGDICAPEPVGQEYPTDPQLAQLRKLYISDSFSAAFLDLSKEERNVVSEALRVGQGAGLFAARLLRDLLIIEALDQQANCRQSEPCQTPPILSYFKIDEMRNKDRSWTDLVEIWRGFRDEDANTGRACLKFAASLPTRLLPPIADQEPVQSPKVTARERTHKTPMRSSQEQPAKKEDYKSVRSVALRPFALRVETEVDICAPEPIGQEYPTDFQLARLRDRFMASSFSAAFLDLSQDERGVVSEALRIGQGAGLFAARLLRDLSIIEALDQQANCQQSEPCQTPPVLSYFKIDEMRDNDRSWVDLVEVWRRFRDEDANAGRACLKLAASLPTRSLPPIAEQESLAAQKVAKAEQSEKPPFENPQEKAQQLTAKDIETNVGKQASDCREQLSSIVGERIFTFEKSSAVISKEDTAFLNDNANLLKTCPSVRLSLQGYTDSDGSKNYNQNLSIRRATAVAAALSAAGVDKSRLDAQGFGDARPLVPNTSRASKKKNRRVEIHIFQK